MNSFRVLSKISQLHLSMISESQNDKNGLINQRKLLRSKTGKEVTSSKITATYITQRQIQWM